jgi:hypothetical protein
MRDDFVRRRRPQIAGAIIEPHPRVDARTRLVARPHMAWRLAEGDKGLEMIANGRTLRFSQGERAALERALSGEAFSAADLEKPLAPEDALNLARRLAEAVLVVPET